MPARPQVKWWRRRESNPRPKARRRGTLHACPLLFSRARREKAAKNRQAPDPEHLTVARRAAAQPPACLMTFDPQPPGEAEANAHSLIRLRERTENPQLTDVPSDLRVNGARHASRDLELPSKPNSPPGRQRAGRSPTHLAIVRHRPLMPALSRPSGPSDTIPWHSFAQPNLGALCRGVQEVHRMVDILDGEPVGRSLGAVVEPQTLQQFTAPPL